MSCHIELKSELSIYFNRTGEETPVLHSEGWGVKKSSESHMCQDQNMPERTTDCLVSQTYIDTRDK